MTDIIRNYYLQIIILVLVSTIPTSIQIFYKPWFAHLEDYQVIFYTLIPIITCFFVIKKYVIKKHDSKFNHNKHITRFGFSFTFLTSLTISLIITFVFGYYIGFISLQHSAPILNAYFHQTPALFLLFIPIFLVLFLFITLSVNIALFLEYLIALIIFKGYLKFKD